jgi:molybdate transport system substrate-binding protein
MNTDKNLNQSCLHPCPSVPHLTSTSSVESWLICLFAFVLTACAAPLARAEAITVSAAISLKEAVTEIAEKYEQKSGDHVDFNFGASGTLESQIAQDAPVDAFISAADKQVNDLIKSGKADPASRHVIVTNAIVLIVPVDAANPPADFAGLTTASVKKIAVGEPKSVPAGQYAMQTLKVLKLADALAGKLVFGANVRQVLDYVEHGEVDAGIVYATDAKQAGDRVKVVATADASTHESIEYPAVVITGAKHATAAARFIDFLATDQAKAIFVAHGFTLPAVASSTRP